MIEPKPVKTNRAPNFQLRFPSSTVRRIEEYRTYLKHKVGLYPTFAETVRNLVTKALTDLGIPEEEENESESNEKNSG